jgi:cell division protein FtsA
VITGGGSQLRHITQLFEYVTGMDCRIGYPNEHVAKAPNKDLISPLFATGVGLVIKGYENGANVTKESLSSDSTRRVAEERKGMKKFLNAVRDWFENEEE